MLHVVFSPHQLGALLGSDNALVLKGAWLTLFVTALIVVPAEALVGHQQSIVSVVLDLICAAIEQEVTHGKRGTIRDCSPVDPALFFHRLGL